MAERAPRTVFVTTAAAAVAFGAAILLGQLAGYDQVERGLRSLDLVWLPICLGAEILAYLGYVLAVRDAARVDGGPRLSLSLAARTVVAGFGVFSATGASGGFAVDYWALRGAGEPRSGAIARVLGLGALEYAVLAPAAMLAALALLVGGGGAHIAEGMTLPWFLVIPGFGAGLWVSSSKRRERFADPGDGGRVRQAFAHAVAGVTMVRRLAEQPRRHGAGVLGASLYWVGDIACLWAGLRVANAHISLAALVLAYATGYVLTRRSLPAGGAGIVEVLLTFALTWVGLPFATAVLGVAVYRVFNFWLPILPALAVVPRLRRLQPFG